MSKEPDDKIEDFFRKATHQPDDIEFRQSDWARMEKMLDADPEMTAPASGSFSKYVVISAGIVFLLVGSWLYFDRSGEARSVKPTSNVSQLEDPHSKSNQADKVKHKQPGLTKSGTENSKVDLHENKLAENQLGNPPADDALFSRQVTQPESKAKKSQRTALVTQLRLSKSTRATNEINKTSFTQQGDVILPRDVAVLSQNAPVNSTDKEFSGIEEDIVHATGKPEGKQMAGNNVIKETKESVLADSTAVEQVVLDRAISKKDSATNEAQSKRKIFRVALLLSPEFSITESTQFTIPGSAYGLQMGYYINNRLLIGAGFLKTRKKYVGHGSDYTPPDGYWQYRTNGMVPNEVKGECSIIEVPIAIQYTLLTRKRGELFASLGASSYFMLDETYKYQFEYANPGAADGWSTEKNSNYLFKVGHMSIGYLHNINEHLLIGIEPYFKLPFDGIGWSKVNLMTTGAYLTVGYKW
jgi:hypothetical protein